LSTIEHVDIHDFQSLRNVSVDLGPFTVIIGASSSGKSAFLRSLTAIASNPRSSTFVSPGALKSHIQVHTSLGEVSLTKGSGHTQYDVQHSGSEVQTHTKLAGSVPEDAQKILGYTETDVAAQFDRPYLLDESGASIARTLGDLTNVSIIFEAVREANRRKNESSAKLKTRQEDLADLKVKAQDFKNLKAHVAKLEQVEGILYQIQAAELRSSYLEGLISSMETAEAVLARVPASVDLPDLEAIQRLYDRRTTFITLLQQVKKHEKALKAAQVGIEGEEDLIRQSQDALHEYLVEIGECPTCQQKILP
jgi:DNA repair ATPase RecN